MPADRVFAIPEGLDEREALAIGGTQGKTAYRLAEGLKEPDGRPIFVSAAAGGVGSVLVQLCVES